MDAPTRRAKQKNAHKCATLVSVPLLRRNLPPLTWTASHKNANSLDVLECGRGVYCCREFGNTGDCCTDSSVLITTGLGKLAVAAKTVTTSSGATSAATSATASSTATQAVTSSLNPSSTAAECPKGNGAVIGGAVGGTLGAALLASLAALAFLYKRRSKGYNSANAGFSDSSTGNYSHKAQSPSQYSYSSPAAQQRATELPSQPVHELAN